MSTSKSILLLALPILGVLGLQAVLPAHSIAAEAIAPDAVQADNLETANRRQALASKAALELVIAQLESSQGTWSAELREAYLALGNALSVLDLNEEAVEALGYALQAHRTSAGLHDPGQVPILQVLLASAEKLEDWDAVDSLHHLMHYISRKSPKAEPELRFQAMVRLSRWTRQATRDKLLSSYQVNPMLMEELYEHEIGHFEALVDYPGRNIHLAGLYLEQAEFEFAQAQFKYDQPIREFQPSGQQRPITTTQCQYVRQRDGSMFQVCTTTETPDLNYYVVSSNRKTAEIRKHLTRMQETIIAAFTVLQQETTLRQQRNALLVNVQRLTAEYNDFVDRDSP